MGMYVVLECLTKCMSLRCSLQVAIAVLNIFFTVRGPGFPWSPKAEGVMSKDDGYAAFPDQDVSDDNYQPPEY